MTYTPDATGDGNALIHGGIKYLIENGMPMTVNADIDIGDVNLLDTAGDPIDPATKAQLPAGLGQALEAASLPVVLTVAQVETLTPPEAITGFATAASQFGPAGGFTGTAAGTSQAMTTGSPWQFPSTSKCYVWVGAPVTTAGAVVNTTPVFIGDSTNQSTPIMPTNYEGFVIGPLLNANLVYAQGVTGNSIAYRILA